MADEALLALALAGGGVAAAGFIGWPVLPSEEGEWPAVVKAGKLGLRLPDAGGTASPDGEAPSPSDRPPAELASFAGPGAGCSSEESTGSFERAGTLAGPGGNTSRSMVSPGSNASRS